MISILSIYSPQLREIYISRNYIKNFSRLPYDIRKLILADLNSKWQQPEFSKLEML